MVRIIDVEQGSDEWLAARAGVLTASVMADMTAKVKSGEAAGRKNLRAKLIAEQLSGRTSEGGFKSAAMMRGNELEEEGIDAYARTFFVTPEVVGFCLHDERDDWGASPDRLLGDDGLIEIKVPNTATHLEYLRKEAVPKQYYKQIQWQLFITGREWCEFVSYEPRLPEPMQLYVERVGIDVDLRTELVAEAEMLMDEVKRACDELREQFGL